MNQFFIYLKSALLDFHNNRLLHIITIMTISLSLLVVSAFGLFFYNVNLMISSWKQGIRIIAYVKNNVPEKRIQDLKRELLLFDGIKSIEYISKETAFNDLKVQLKHQSGLLESLKENPLPASLDIRVDNNIADWNKVQSLAHKINSLPEIMDVEYGKGWLEKVDAFFNLFKFTCFAIGFLLLVTSIFVVSNTIRLVFYARRDEIEIMRLVGATTWYIKAPFYLEGVIQGSIGSFIGLGTLYTLFIGFFYQQLPSWSQTVFQPRFFSFGVSLLIVLSTISIGWVGSYLSLRRFIKI